MKLLLVFLCCITATCQPLPFSIKVGAYYQNSSGEQVGASVELDPSYAKQKK